jgi:Mn2+/Fe2+ NRAMP family transporter
MLAAAGPGIIIAGSIVGSGELIATTKVGAESGFYLLWLILLGCAIKVFTQIEIGRYTLLHGRTPLEGLNQVPGPRWRVNYIVWYWVVMTCFVMLQQGGIAGGVGQALSIAMPLSSAGREYNHTMNQRVAERIEAALAAAELAETAASDDTDGTPKAIEAASLPNPPDEMVWTLIVCLATSVLLYFGRFGLIELVSMVLVGGFTVTTLATLGMLQFQPHWAITGDEFMQGLRFGLPPVEKVRAPLATALAAFGIIGVGAAELIMYPYWCLEKGYARFTGPNDGTTAWLERARGWMRMMRFDAWLSMVVYTLATAGFFLLGAAVLGRAGLDPQHDMIRTLSQMYVPVFGAWAQPMFLIGAVAVLYSTLFVAAAGNARMVTDGLFLLGVLPRTASPDLWMRRISAAWPLVACALYFFVRDSARMVLLCGAAQMLMLPLLGSAALYFRYRKSVPGLQPGKAWDACLWISVVGFFVTAGYFLWGLF